MSSVGGKVGAAPSPTSSTIAVRKNSVAVGSPRGQVNFVEGTNVTLTVTDDGAEIDVTIAASGGGATLTRGTATLDFGSLPGSNLATVTVVDAGVAVGSVPQVYILGTDSTAAHSAYEHAFLSNRIALSVTTISTATASQSIWVAGGFDHRFV